MEPNVAAEAAQAMGGHAQCEAYGNFVAKAFCQGGPVMYIIAVVGPVDFIFNYRTIDEFAKVDCG